MIGKVKQPIKFVFAIPFKFAVKPINVPITKIKNPYKPEIINTRKRTSDIIDKISFW